LSFSSLNKSEIFPNQEFKSERQFAAPKKQAPACSYYEDSSCSLEQTLYHPIFSVAHTDGFQERNPSFGSYQESQSQLFYLADESEARGPYTYSDFRNLSNTELEIINQAESLAYD